MPRHKCLYMNFESKEDEPSFRLSFVVTYGRSGSTLLQGLLNSIPRYCIRGENYNAMFYMFRAYQQLEGGSEEIGAGSRPIRASRGMESTP
jgi:hypothetical protein